MAHLSVMGDSRVGMLQKREDDDPRLGIKRGFVPGRDITDVPVVRELEDTGRQYRNRWDCRVSTPSRE